MPLAARYNKIEIRFIPNPQYTNHPSSKSDKIISGGHIIKIHGNQINNLEIVKSHDTHLTDVTLMLSSLEHTSTSALAEGKYMVSVTISNVTDTKNSTKSFHNNFLCEKMIVTGVTDVYGTFPTLDVTLHLKSIFRYRLEIENNFAFELGGKGGIPAIGGGSSSLNFLYSDFLEKINETYSPEVSSSTTKTGFLDMQATIGGIGNSGDVSVLNQTVPDSGYKMEVDTNLEVLDFFFEHYPVFSTPYGWVIDDFNTNLGKNLNPSIISLKDFLRYDTWKMSWNSGLSQIISGRQEDASYKINVPSNSTADIQTQNEIGAMGIYNYHISNRASYYNTSRFLIENNNPLIFAQNIITGQPIDLGAWNALNKEVTVLTSSATNTRVKPMPNPMYKQLSTHLSADEITRTQKYKNIFFNLHPELITHEFTNLWVGEVDIHDSYFISKKSVNEKAHYDKDRYGIGYHVKHNYHPVQSTPATHTFDEKEGGIKTSSIYEPKFILTTSYTALVVDAGPVDLVSYDKTGNDYLHQDLIYNNADLSNFMDIDPCADENGVNLGKLAYAEPGSPGNTSISTAANSLYKTGFKYNWGSANSRYMDCSAFTMYAVRNGGGDQGRHTHYPNGTSAQMTWLSDPDNGAQRVEGVENIQPGDIVFFHTSGNGPWGHTAIAKDSSNYYESSSVNHKGANIGSFSRTPAYIFRLSPMTNQGASE